MFAATSPIDAEFDAASLVGRDSVLWFWAPRCTVCRAEAPGIDEAVQRFGDDVQIVGVAGRGAIDEMRDFIDDSGTAGLTPSPTPPSPIAAGTVAEPIDPGGAAMSGGLVGLLDDIAALAKMAAASIDDVGTAASRASVKAAGVVVDDTAVTPTYVHGLAAERELPIIKRIASGSLRNKLVFILPAALVLSEFVPILVEIILMCGGAYLCFEGAEKIHHRFAAHDDDHELPAAAQGADQEAATVTGAIRTDFILSAEIMVIALKEVIDEGFVSRAIILLVVAVAITIAVYGVVALIVKMDDAGLRMVESGRPPAMRVGRALVTGMPKLLAVLSLVGTVAMIWVGGHILLAGSDELGWHGPYELVHDLEDPLHDVAGVGGALAWLVNTAASFVVGLVVGLVLVAIVSRLDLGRSEHEHVDHATAHG